MPHLQIKDMPPGLHESLRSRAKRSRVSMREYVLRLIEADVGDRDTWQELLERLSTKRALSSDAPDAVELIRRAREERTDRLLRK